MTPGRPVAPLLLSLAMIAGTATGQESLPPPTTEPVAQPAPESPSISRDERAVEILTAAQEALNQTKNVSMSVRSEIVAESGLLQAFKLGAEGNVWAQRDENGRWTRAMVGQADDIGTSQQIAFTVVKSDLNASWIDHEKQEVVHSTGRFAKGRVYGSAELLGMDLLFTGTPYARQLNAQKLESLGTEVVEGTLCDIVRAEIGERNLPTRWYIGAGDGFPRRIVEELVEGAQRVYEFTDIQIDTEIEPSRFEIEAPGTYVVVNLPERRTAVNAPTDAQPIVSTPDAPVGEIYGTEVGALGAPFTAEDVFGTKYNTEDYLGKPLVLYFWASWLPGTSTAIDEMIRLHEHIGENGTLLTLATRERQPENASNAVLEAGGDDIPVITSAAQAAAAYNVAKVPVVIIIDAEGKIAYRNENYVIGTSIDEVVAELDKLGG